jgi:hypothetical protein
MCATFKTHSTRGSPADTSLKGFFFFPCCRLPGWGCQSWAALGVNTLCLVKPRVAHQETSPTLRSWGELFETTAFAISMDGTSCRHGRKGSNGAMAVTMLCPHCLQLTTHGKMQAERSAPTTSIRRFTDCVETINRHCAKRAPVTARRLLIRMCMFVS